MWVARNKGENTRPNMFYHKPSRQDNGRWYALGCDYGYPLYDEHQFDSLTWEDEPIEVKIVSKDTDTIEMQNEEAISRQEIEGMAWADTHPKNPWHNKEYLEKIIDKTQQQAGIIFRDIMKRRDDYSAFDEDFMRKAIRERMQEIINEFFKEK